MNTIELAYNYLRGEISESALLALLGNEDQVANVVSISYSLSKEELDTIKKILR